MTHKVRIKALAILSFVILFMIPATAANAATPTYGHRYSLGVGNVTVWLNYASGVGNWESYIVNAANNWMYPGWDNPIYMNFVSSNNGSMMDFHLNSSSYFQSSSIIAQTEFYNNGPTGVNQWYSNWDFTEIHINNDQYSSPSFSNDQALGTTIHEMGHSFGLAHWQTNPYSIMCQTGAGRIVQRVQQVDNDAVNILY